MLWAAALTAAMIVTALPAEAQGQGRRGGRGGGNILSIPEVQKELKLEAAQIELLNALNQGGRGNRESFQNMTPEQRREAFAKLRAEREKKVAEILDAKQVARLKQLELQQDGLRSIRRDDVALQLKLTADQKQKIDAALDAEREGQRAAFEGFRGNNGQRPSAEQIQAARAKMTELRTSTDAKLNAVLTDPQKAQWKTMIGAPFTFPERQRGPRRQRPNNNA
jgi:Spy/CpxP family protein refolding chaperone